MEEVKLDGIISNLTDIQYNITLYVFNIHDDTEKIITALEAFKNSINEAQINVTAFDTKIKEFYKKQDSSSSFESYKSCYEKWKSDSNNLGCKISDYFNSNLNPETYGNVVKAFNALYTALNDTSDNPVPYTAYRVFIY